MAESLTFGNQSDTLKEQVADLIREYAIKRGYVGRLEAIECARLAKRLGITKTAVQNHIDAQSMPTLEVMFGKYVRLFGLNFLNDFLEIIGFTGAFPADGGKVNLHQLIALYNLIGAALLKAIDPNGPGGSDITPEEYHGIIGMASKVISETNKLKCGGL